MKGGKVSLGSIEVSVQGLGCMGMSQSYGPADWDSSIETIRGAVELGVTFLDTADIYGAGHNEVLVGRAISSIRDHVQLATKFGIVREGEWRQVRGDRRYVHHACESSLKRLGTDWIDLYYLHRPPENTEIEETVGAMAELVSAGKVREIGLSGVDAEQLRRARSVHPVAAVQMEYSLWNRDVEEELSAVLGDAVLVAYSPLGRGFLTGSFDRSTLQPGDFRLTHPRFTEEAVRSNHGAIEDIERIAAELEATPAQVALAWLHFMSGRWGTSVVPIPGSKRLERVEENWRATTLRLRANDLELLDGIARRTV